MAGAWFNLAIVLLCINVFLYAGAIETGIEIVDFENDALGQFMEGEFNKSQVLDDASEVGIDVDRTALAMPERDTPETTGSTFLEVLNSLDLAFDAINIILSIAFAPLIFFQIEGIPYIVAFILAWPMIIGFWMSIIQLIRGAS